MNKVLLTGRLARDAEVRQASSSLEKGRLFFTLAVQREYKNVNGEKEADFIPIIMWTKFADKLKMCLTKGKRISVTGWINVSSYEASDGQKKYSTQIVAENIEFLDSKKNEAV